MTTITFPDAGGLGAPYAVSAADWSQIDERAARVIELQDDADRTAIANYGDLLAVCQKWQSTTLPGLLSHAASTVTFATDAATEMTKLSGALLGLQPSDPVPHSVSFIIGVRFDALADTAGERAQEAAALATDIGAFAIANKVTDETVELTSLFGGAPSVAGLLGTVSGAISQVQDAWTPIVGQLQAVAASRLQITTADLLDSNLDSATQSWNALAGAASTFVNSFPRPGATA